MFLNIQATFTAAELALKRVIMHTKQDNNKKQGLREHNKAVI